MTYDFKFGFELSKMHFGILRSTSEHLVRYQAVDEWVLLP